MLDKNQSEELIDIIKKSSKIKSDLAKKVIIWLLLKSQNGTKKVAVSIYPKAITEVEEIVKLAREVWEGVHDSSNVLYEYLKSINTAMHFSQSGGMYVIDKDINFYAHEGSIINKTGERVLTNINESFTATIWFSPKSIDHTSEVLVLDMKEVNAIEL